MSKILVTGGAGFIASQVADKFIEEGHEVIILDNLSTGLKSNINSKAKFYEMDIRDLVEIEKIFETEKIEFVYHLAAQISVPESVENPMKDEEINIMGTLNLLHLSSKYDIRKFVFTSTGGAVYGDNAPMPTTEEYPPNPISPYAISKMAAEKYVEFYGREYNLNYTILRYSNVYGPRQIPKGEAGVMYIFCERMLNDKEVTIDGDGEQTRDFLYVKDVVMANYLALTKGDKEKINISTETSTNINELFNTIAKYTGYNKEPRRGSPRRGDVRFSLLSNKKAKEILNWEPAYNLDKGVKDTIEWYKTIV